MYPKGRIGEVKSESKHTPGPWKHDPYWSLIMAGKCEIAAVHAATQVGEKRKRLDEAHANARLIAAAPDLLEALRRINRTSVRETFHGDVERFQEWLDAFTADTIQKAEGAS